MTRNDVQHVMEAVLAGFGRRVADLGFIAEIEKQRFVFSGFNISRVVHLAFIEHVADADVTIDVAVRLDDVDRVIGELGGPVGSFTVGNELGNLSPDRRQARFRVSVKKEVDAVVGQLYEFFCRIGLPFFDQMASPKAVFDAVSAEDRSALQVIPVTERRWFVQLAIAVLLRDREGLELVLRRQNESPFVLQTVNPERMRSFRERAVAAIDAARPV